jgi:tetratricopeptide (TPR) repeat protein
MMKNILLFVLVLQLIQSHVFACTIIFSNDGKNVYVGNNEDFLNTAKSKIWFVPASAKKYGAAYWGFNYFPFKAQRIPQGGMNEHGLFFDKTSVPEKALKMDKDKRNAGAFYLSRILERCKTVDEAIEMIQTRNLKHFTKGQIFIADKTGNYAIIDNNVITKKTKDYAVITNFRVSEPELGGFPSQKYNSGMKMLEHNNEASCGNFENILNEVHQVGSEYSTIYSQICDLKNGKINLYHFHNFEHRKVVDLKEELKKGKHAYYIVDFFPARIFPVIYDTYLSFGLTSALSNLEQFKNEKYSFCESELYFFAHHLFEHFLYDNTMQVCDTILTYFPESDEALLLKAKCLVSKNELEKSIQLVKQSFQINPFNFSAGRIIQQLDNPKKDGNTHFKLKGFEDANFVTIVMSTENWEDLYHIMYRDGDSWKYSVDLPKGHYEYIYKVDGKFVLDPSVSTTKVYPTTTVMVLEKE